MITPINPIGLSPIRGPADNQTPKVAAEQAAAKVPELRKPEAEKTETSERKSHVPGAPQPPVPAYDLRLTVDKDPETGEVVYKSINRLTGEVVSQMPNAEIMEMKRRESFGAGAIFSTEV